MITKNPMQLKAFIKNKAAEKHISAQLVMQNYFRRKSALTGTGFLAVLFWRTMHVFLKSTVKITDIVVTAADCNAADGSNSS